MRILYLHPGPVPPSTNPLRNEFSSLSSAGLTGDLLSILWEVPEQTMHEHAQQVNQACGNFSYHYLPESSATGMFRNLQLLWFFVMTGWRLHRTLGRYDAVVSYSTFTPGIAAYLLRLLTGAKFIAEIPGVPTASAQSLGRHSALAKCKHWLARQVTSFLLRRADGVKLLYESQLGDLPQPRLTVAFHDYVPVSDLSPCEWGDKEKSLLFLGFPWHLKGVDLLIQAFLQIADQVPDYHLKIVGHCPDRTPFEALAKEHERIHLMKAVYPDEAKELMRASRLFVLPSRTEAMGRVLLEAMACGTPIVASRVDGIPAVVEHEFNGLLFESENVKELANCLLQVLTNQTLAQQLAANGHRRVHDEFSEQVHATKFADFLERVCNHTHRQTSAEPIQTRHASSEVKHFSP